MDIFYMYISYGWLCVHVVHHMDVFVHVLWKALCASPIYYGWFVCMSFIDGTRPNSPVEFPRPLKHAMYQICSAPIEVVKKFSEMEFNEDTYDN